jgi:hypothetical protein
MFILIYMFLDTGEKDKILKRTTAPLITNYKFVFFLGYLYVV